MEIKRRTCIRCHIEKDFPENFYKDPHNTTGYYNICKKCISASTNKRNKERRAQKKRILGK